MESRHYEPTYRMKPYEEQKFSPPTVTAICKDVMDKMLADKVWTDEEETVWAVQITEQIKNRVRDLRYPRYKIAVQVVLGQNKNQGAQLASRCLWDAETDNYASYTFKNDALWCTAIVFGAYTE